MPVNLKRPLSSLKRNPNGLRPVFKKPSHTLISYLLNLTILTNAGN